MAAKKQEKSIQAGKAMQARRKPCLFVRILEVLLLLLLLAILGGVLLLQKGYLGKEDLMQNPVAEKVHAATHSYAVSISEILPGDGVYPMGMGRSAAGWSSITLGKKQRT